MTHNPKEDRKKELSWRIIKIGKPDKEKTSSIKNSTDTAEDRKR